MMLVFKWELVDKAKTSVRDKVYLRSVTEIECKNTAKDITDCLEKLDSEALNLQSRPADIIRHGDVE